MNPKIEDIAEEAADALRAMDEDSSFYEPVLLEFFGRFRKATLEEAADAFRNRESVARELLRMAKEGE